MKAPKDPHAAPTLVDAYDVVGELQKIQHSMPDRSPEWYAMNQAMHAVWKLADRANERRMIEEHDRRALEQAKR